MKDLFSPSNFIWIIPLGLFAVTVICLTTYALRKEISSFLKNLFFPEAKRYALPAQIISNVDEKGGKPAKVMKESIKQDSSKKATPEPKKEEPKKQEAKKEQPKAEPPAPSKTEVMETPLKSNLKRQKPVKNIFEELAVALKWNWRKVKRFLTPKEKMATSMAVQMPKEEPKPEPVKEAPPQEEKPVSAPAQSMPQNTAPVIQESQTCACKKHIISDRLFFTIAIILLTGAVIFLGARMYLLGTIIKRQHVMIKQLQETALSPQKTIIYVLPATKETKAAVKAAAISRKPSRGNTQRK